MTWHWAYLGQSIRNRDDLVGRFWSELLTKTAKDSSKLIVVQLGNPFRGSKLQIVFVVQDTRLVSILFCRRARRLHKSLCHCSEKCSCMLGSLSSSLRGFIVWAPRMRNSDVGTLMKQPSQRLTVKRCWRTQLGTIDIHWLRFWFCGQLVNRLLRRKTQSAFVTPQSCSRSCIEYVVIVELCMCVYLVRVWRRCLLLVWCKVNEFISSRKLRILLLCIFLLVPVEYSPTSFSGFQGGSPTSCSPNIQ